VIFAVCGVLAVTGAEDPTTERHRGLLRGRIHDIAQNIHGHLHGERRLFQPTEKPVTANPVLFPGTTEKLPDRNTEYSNPVAALPTVSSEALGAVHHRGVPQSSHPVTNPSQVSSGTTGVVEHHVGVPQSAHPVTVPAGVESTTVDPGRQIINAPKRCKAGQELVNDECKDVYW